MLCRVHMHISFCVHSASARFNQMISTVRSRRSHARSTDKSACECTVGQSSRPHRSIALQINGFGSTKCILYLLLNRQKLRWSGWSDRSHLVIARWMAKIALRRGDANTLQGEVKPLTQLHGPCRTDTSTCTVKTSTFRIHCTGTDSGLHEPTASKPRI